ncbi:hypothetical protein D3C72_1878040 [compost metagenome]
MNRHMPYVNVHGHIHGQKYEGIQHFNVSVELWDYRPVSFENMMDILKTAESSGEKQSEERTDEGD